MLQGSAGAERILVLQLLQRAEMFHRRDTLHNNNGSISLIVAPIYILLLIAWRRDTYQRVSLADLHQ